MSSFTLSILSTFSGFKTFVVHYFQGFATFQKVPVKDQNFQGQTKNSHPQKF